MSSVFLPLPENSFDNLRKFECFLAIQIKCRVERGALD